jgi:hypothetical protein
MGHVMMRIALVLLCLVMISFHLMGSMYARYTTKASSSNDARVAKFDVKVNGSDDVTIDCKVGEDGTYEITVNNESEVAVSYKISVSHGAVDGVSSSLNNNSGVLAPGTTTQAKDHVLTFTVDWAKFTADVENAASKTVSFKFTVTIDVVQVD